MTNFLPTGFRGTVDQATATALDALVSAFNRLFGVEHTRAGSHGAVHLVSLDLTPITPPVLTANTNDYTPPSLTACSYLRIASTGGVNLTGLAAATVTRLLWVRNVGAANITLTHQDAASAAVNRFTLPNAANLVLGAGEGVTLLYDLTSTTWATFQQ